VATPQAVREDRISEARNFLLFSCCGSVRIGRTSQQSANPYGSLGAAIGTMMWISSIVILFGAQLNSEIEHQTARDSTVEHDKPLGARGAVMADTVGAAV
jgi:uncharacterized BrkB/YihY/UPF0761 family membrane protein